MYVILRYLMPMEDGGYYKLIGFSKDKSILEKYLDEKHTKEEDHWYDEDHETGEFGTILSTCYEIFKIIKVEEIKKENEK